MSDSRIIDSHASWTRRDFLCATSLAAAALVSARTSQAAAPTSAAANASKRIAVIADTHSTRSVEGDKPTHKPNFEKVIAQVNAAEVELVLMAGDLAESGKAEEYRDFREQSRALRAPQVWVPGNHDVGGKHIVGADGTVKGGITQKRLEQYEAEFDLSFWIKEAAGLRIVGLNASLPGSALTREAEQWEFLEATLAQPAIHPTLLLTHYPPFLKEPNEPGDYWNFDPAPRARLLNLLTTGNVRGVVSGHLHRPIVAQRNGVAWVTAPAVSFGLPRDRQAVGWALLTITPQGEIQTELRTLET